MQDEGTRPQGWFRVWCSSAANMLAYQFKRFAIFAWVLLVLANVVAFAAVIEARRDAVRRFQRTDMILCEKFTVPIRNVILRSIKTLPTLAYYKEHPDELVNAQAENRRLLNEFGLGKCKHLPSKGAK